MKISLLALLLSTAVVADEAQSNPLGKVVELMNALEAKVTAEGEAEAKAFKAFFEWCDEAAANTNYEIKTSTSKAAKLSAKLDELNSDVEVGTSKVGDLSEAIAKADAELKEATGIRNKESADFQSSEQELMSTVDTLARAGAIIEKQSGAALAQIDMSSMQSLVQSLSVVVDAAAFSSIDKSKLVALVQAQQQQGQNSEDEELGAPSAAKYKSQSGGISELLEDLKEKAEGELADARKAESEGKHNFAMVKQSLEDKLVADQKDMDDEKSGVAAAQEGKGVAAGDLAGTQKALKNSQAALKTATTDCMRSAADHEATVAARTEELKVIAKAKDILKESTGGAESQTYSLLQVAASAKSRTELASSEVVNMVKKLAHDQHSAALSQLASRISAVVRYGGSGGDPFAKVKGLITDMLSKLEQAAESEATEKAYCDEQMSKTEAKKGSLEADIEKLSSKIDQAASRSAELKEEVAETQSELAGMAKAQAEMDKIRAEQNAAYTTAKAELSAGLAGVRKAVGMLREYYGGDAGASMLQDDAKFGAFMQQPAAPQQHEKASGAGGSIISILEIVESDFATNLAKEETEEADAAAAYEKMTQQNAVSKTGKDQDVKYKGAESAALDKSIAEVTGDKNSASAEQAAVLEYYAKIKERCVAKPESYEEKKARREAEINGLKEALSVLENETAFVQRRKHRGAHFMQAF